ncbi:MAG: type 4a pilus biogenesis protein PilO [Magnetococcales bacterium]|nr:type 4a pilus biogenesis protein PilO [Magnetococcales bacterium]
MELGFDPLIVLRLKPIQKIGVALGLLLLFTALYWYFFLQDRLNVMEKLQAEIQQQEDQISSKRRLLTKLPQMREELARLKMEEERLAQKLPSEKEIPTLLTDISTAGHEQGLEFLLFAPGPEISRDLYAEVPVGMEMRGSFHAIALFVDRVAKMSRIVTFADISMEPPKDPKEQKNQRDMLVAKARATTYRFLSQQALEQKERASKGAGDRADKTKGGK